jgi:hypothetical protein
MKDAMDSEQTKSLRDAIGYLESWQINLFRHAVKQVDSSQVPWLKAKYEELRKRKFRRVALVGIFGLLISTGGLFWAWWNCDSEISVAITLLLSLASAFTTPLQYRREYHHWPPYHELVYEMKGALILVASRIRAQSFEPAFNDKKADYLTARKNCSIWRRRFLAMAFGASVAVMVMQSIFVALFDWLKRTVFPHFPRF